MSHTHPLDCFAPVLYPVHCLKVALLSDVDPARLQSHTGAPQVIKSGDTVHLAPGQGLQLEVWGAPSRSTDWHISTSAPSHPERVLPNALEPISMGGSDGRIGAAPCTRYVWSADEIAKLGPEFIIRIASDRSDLQPTRWLYVVMTPCRRGRPRV